MRLGLPLKFGRTPAQIRSHAMRRGDWLLYFTARCARLDVRGHRVELEPFRLSGSGSRKLVSDTKTRADFTEPEQLRPSDYPPALLLDRRPVQPPLVASQKATT